MVKTYHQPAVVVPPVPEGWTGGKSPEPNIYTVYWLDGTREVIRGTDIANAFANAGYVDGSLRAMDMWRWGNDTDYAWDRAKRIWVRDIAAMKAQD